MADKSPAEKMRLQPGMTAALLHVPPELKDRLGIPEGVAISSTAAGADFILEVASTQAEAEARLEELRPSIGDKTIAWLAYPKGSKAAGLDISRDTVFGYVPTLGLTLVANVSIDEKWSALRARPLEK